MKHWVFDLDGTLVDSHKVYFDSLRLILNDFNADLSLQDEKEVLSIPVKSRQLFFDKKLGQENSHKALAAFETRLLSDDQRIEVFKGIPALLEKLKSQNCKIGIWTAREMSSAKRVLNSTELAPYFSYHMSGSCVANCKPSPEGLERIAYAFQCETKELLMVGDHDNDMLAAKACGAKAIRANWNNPQLKSNEHTDDFCFTEVESLLKWVSTMLPEA